MRARLHRTFFDRTPTDIQRLTRIYDTSAPTWERREARGENLAVSKAWRSGLVDRLAGDVLEIGIGAGDTVRRLNQRLGQIRSYTGVDISTGMLAEAQKYAKDAQYPITLRQANAESLAMFPDNAFDTVTASLVLCTVPDMRAALAEMARVCKPQGQILLIEHVLAPNPAVRLVQKVAAPWQVRHMGCHIDRTTNQVLRDLGFRIENDRTRWFGVFHFIQARPPSDRVSHRRY